MKVTKNDIKIMALKIKEFLVKENCNVDVSIFYNNKEIYKIKEDGSFDEKEDVDPHDCFEYAAIKHILSMTFEGELYYALNYSSRWGEKIKDGLTLIFCMYGMYYELGNAWNLTVFPNRPEMYEEIEYTDYSSRGSHDSKEEKVFQIGI